MAPVDPTQYPPHQSSRMGNLYVEESLPLWHCWPFKNIPYHKLVLPHWSNRLQPQHAPAVPSKFCCLGIWGTRRVLLLQCNTNGSIRHQSTGTSYAQPMVVMGFSCIEHMVYQLISPLLSMHQDHHVRHWLWMYHGHVPLQTPSHSISEVTATDCILEATHHLTAAIEGVKDTAPNKLQAIKSLRHILLGKQIPQQPCWLPSYPSLILTCEPSSQLTWLLQNPQQNLRSITNSP